MGGQNWVVHVAQLLVSRGGQRVRRAVGKLPPSGAKPKAHEPETGAGANGAETLPVPEASQSAAVSAETPLTRAEAAASDLAAETVEQPLDDAERTANTVGAEVAGSYGAHSGAVEDPNVVAKGPTGSAPVVPDGQIVAPSAGDVPAGVSVGATPSEEPTEGMRTTRWPQNETPAFTPDSALDLVEDIEFAFEPEDSADDAADASRGWVKGDGSRECPETFPIKGNGTSHIYHMPGQPSYAGTIAEVCFATEQDAIESGYRATKRSRQAS